MSSRSERCNPNTGTDEQNSFVLQKILASAAKGTIHHDPRQSAVDMGVTICANNLATYGGVTFALRLKVAPYSF